jgi:hypothetical protein
VTGKLKPNNKNALLKYAIRIDTLYVELRKVVTWVTYPRLGGHAFSQEKIFKRPVRPSADLRTSFPHEK